MITNNGHIYFRKDDTWGGHWRFGAGQITVHCDAYGCSATAKPRGIERNGPTIECIYGMDGWYMREKDLCPKHAPPRRKVYGCIVCDYEQENEGICPRHPKYELEVDYHWVEGEE